MNKLLLIMLLSVSFCYSQDTLILDVEKKVVIKDDRNKWEVNYYYKNNPLVKDGKYYFKNYFNSKKIEKFGFYKNGLKDGVLKIFENDTLVYEGKFKNDKLHGEQKEFNNKHLERESNYKFGLRKGMWKYYENGSLIAKGRYSAKFIDVSYDETNAIYKFSKGKSVIIPLINKNKQDSLLNIYDVCTSLPRIWLRSGNWKYYSEKGQIIQKIHYSNLGKLKQEKIFIQNEVCWSIIW